MFFIGVLNWFVCVCCDDSLRSRMPRRMRCCGDSVLRSVHGCLG